MGTVWGERVDVEVGRGIFGSSRLRFEGNIKEFHK
jgi:hypothetical protein